MAIHLDCRFSLHVLRKNKHRISKTYEVFRLPSPSLSNVAPRALCDTALIYPGLSQVVYLPSVHETITQKHIIPTMLAVFIYALAFIQLK